MREIRQADVVVAGVGWPGIERVGDAGPLRVALGIATVKRRSSGMRVNRLRGMGKRWLVGALLAGIVAIAPDCEAVIVSSGNATSFGSAGPAAITHGLTINSGDVVVALIAANTDGNTITDNNGANAFTQTIQENTPAAGQTMRYAIYYRVAGPSEPASYSWTLGSPANDWSIVLRVFSGVDTASVWDVAPSVSTRTGSPADGTTATAPSMTTATPGAMGIVAFFSDGLGTTYSAPTNGYSTLVQQGGGRSVASAVRTWPTAGATGTTSATLAPSDDWTAHQFALKPAACCFLDTVEAAGSITITAPAAFKMVYSTAAGGGMMELYDLAEDPLGAVDLAGGDSPPGGHARSLHSSGLQVGAGVFWNSGTNDTGSQLELLEATATRVRVRQDAFYQNAPGGPILGGVKAIGDHSIYPSGRVGLRWERRVTDPAGVPYVSEYKEIFLHLVAAPLDTWQGYHDAGALPGVGSGQSHFILGQIENTTVSPGARTDILEILHRDWTAGNGHFNTANNTRGGPSGSRYNIFWQEFDGETNGLTLPDGRMDVWNSLTYIKPTTLADHLDADVTGRSADYRGPAIPGITAGSTWRDADENTATDDFNEAEAAYLFTLHPTNGLRFDVDGAGTTRFAPFFKIRQWRSLFAPQTITFDVDSGGPTAPVTLARDTDYRADVKRCRARTSPRT